MNTIYAEIININSVRKNLTTAVVSLILVLALSYAALSKPAVKLKHSDPDAVEAVQGVYNTCFSLHEIKADVHLVIQDPEFLKDFFDEEGYNSTGVKGLLHFQDKTGCRLLLRRSSDMYNCFELGNNVNYTGMRRVKRRPGSSLLRISEAQAGAAPAASPEAVPDSQISPTPSPTNTPTPSADQNFINPHNIAGKAALDSYLHLLTPLHTSAPRDYPLSFILPYTLNSRLHGNIYTVVNKNAFVFSEKCMEISAENPRSPYLTTLWVDTKHNRLLQVMRFNKKENIKIIASYVGAYTPDPKTGFSPYKRVEISINGFPVCFAELTEVRINPSKPVVTIEKETNVPERPTITNYVTNDIVPFLSEQKIKLVTVLLLVLLVLILRFVIFVASRQEFSDELIVIDEPGGIFSETLNKLGYKVIPFSIEVLSEERHHLGKNATKDTTSRPHAVIVAPQSFNEVANHAFLIRAYVEEGGRVLVMHHPKQMEHILPFKAEMLPIPNIGIAIESDTDTLTALHKDELNRLASTYVTKEAYLTIDGKKFNKSLLVLSNKLTGIKAVAIGSVKKKKGEYLVWQMKFSCKQLASDTSLQLLLNDVIRYMLGLEPLPYEHEPEI